MEFLGQKEKKSKRKKKGIVVEEPEEDPRSIHLNKNVAGHIYNLLCKNQYPKDIPARDMSKFDLEWGE